MTETCDETVQQHNLARMPRRQGRPSKAEAAELDQRILDAAFAAFLSEGFDRATFDGIAEASGSTRPSIMRRYRDKAELFLAAAWQFKNKSSERMWRDIESKDAIEELRVSCRRVLDHGLDRHSVAFARASAANVERIAGLSELVLGWDKEICHHLETIILRAQKEGFLLRQSAASLAITLMALMISYPINRAMLGDDDLKDPRGQDMYFSTAWANFLAVE